MKKYIILSCLIITFIIGMIVYLISIRIDYTLPKNPIVFESEIYHSPKKDDSAYHMIKYKNRSFVLYGTLNKRITKKNVKKVLGYISLENKKDKNSRILALNETDDYLMEFYVKGEMEQATFYRALDTTNKKIYTPDYIESLKYDIWE